MTLALVRLQLPCQPQSEPRHHSSIRPTPCPKRFDAEHEGERETKKKKKKKEADVMSNNAMARMAPVPPAGSCDDASSSRSEKGGKPIPPALLLSSSSSLLSGMVVWADWVREGAGVRVGWDGLD